MPSATHTPTVSVVHLHLRLFISSLRLYISTRFIWGGLVEGRSWICFRYLEAAKMGNIQSISPHPLLLSTLRPNFPVTGLWLGNRVHDTGTSIHSTRGSVLDARIPSWTHRSMVPNNHRGSLAKGISIPWKRAILVAMAPDNTGSRSS